MTSVAVSVARRASESSAVAAPTLSVRSRRPVTRQVLTPTPNRSSSTVASCADVPDVAMTPTRPALTALANPMPMPSMMAVSHPGPMRRWPASCARRFSTTSSSIDMPSLTSITSAPAPMARWASSAAYPLGTPMTTRPAVASPAGAATTNVSMGVSVGSCSGNWMTSLTASPRYRAAGTAASPVAVRRSRPPSRAGYRWQGQRDACGAPGTRRGHA